MTFSFGRRAPISTELYAEAFGLSQGEAEADCAALLAAGAEPFSIHEEGEVLSQGFGIPFTADGCWLLYLYALTTTPAARGRGLLRTLLREVSEGACAAGYTALTLLPASEPLAEAYGRMGFTERYPAAAAPVIHSGEDVYLKTAEPPKGRGVRPSKALYRALGRHLSPALFAFTLSTVKESLLPFRTDGGEYALLLRSDRRRALVLPEGTEASEEGGGAAYLLLPLYGRPPRSLPEPMPR